MKGREHEKELVRGRGEVQNRWREHFNDLSSRGKRSLEGVGEG